MKMVERRKEIGSFIDIESDDLPMHAPCLIQVVAEPREAN